MTNTTVVLVGYLLALSGAEASPRPDPEPIVLHDMLPSRALDLSRPEARSELWDACHLLASLQGLANRDAPRLYVRWIEPWDSYWLDWLRSEGHWLAGRPVEEVPDLVALLARFRSSYRGVVAYDPEPASLAAVASTVAGVEGLLALRRDPRPGSLFERLVLSGPRLPVIESLSAETVAPGGPGRKCAPYLWARDRYLQGGKCDPNFLAYYIDSWWLSEPFRGNHENHTLSNHDYFIARKAFFFDLSPWDDEAPVDDPTQTLGEDARTLCSILRAAYDARGGRGIAHVGGFVPWAWKYTNHSPGASRHDPVPAEWRYAQILSAHDAMMDADALGPCAMANASFYAHYPLRERYPQAPRPTEADLKKAGLLGEDGLLAPGAYVAFYVGDYDSAAWLYREFPRAWNDPARGRVPLGWAINPNLERRAPMALAWARETASPLDIFTTGDSGAGYLNPGALEVPREYSGLPSGVRAWEEFSLPFLRRWDLTVAGFIIDGFAPSMGDEAWSAYARMTPDGLGGQKVPARGVRAGLPFVRVVDAPSSVALAVDSVAAQASPEKRSFFYLRTILKSAGWHEEFARRLHAIEPSARVVDPHVLLSLVAIHERTRDRYPKPQWTKPDVAWSPGAAEGLKPVPHEDGSFAVEESSGRKAATSRSSDGRATYVYFLVHDGFPSGKPEDLECELIYLDEGRGRFLLEYDGPGGAYTSSEAVTLEDSRTWRTARVKLPGARLENGQNAGADLRIVNCAGTLRVSAIRLRR